LCFIYCNGRCF